MLSEDEGGGHLPVVYRTVVTPSDLTWKTVGNVIEPKVRLMLELVGALRRREGEEKPPVREIREEDSFLEACRSGLGALTQWFDDRVRPVVENELGACAGVDRVISRRCEFAANYCLGKLHKPRRRVNRGRMCEMVQEADGTERLLTRKERRQKAAVKSAAHQRAVSLWNLKKEMHVALVVEREIRKTGFIKSLSTAPKSVAYDLWHEAIAEIGVEFRDGSYRYTAKPLPAHTSNPSRPVQALRAVNVSFDDASGAGHPANPIDLPFLDPGSGPPEVGILGCERQTCACGPADVRADTVDRAPEAVDG